MSKRQVLILDDDPAFRAEVRGGIDGLFDFLEAGSVQEFRQLWKTRHFDLLLLDMRLRRDREGLDVLRGVFAQDACQPVIMVSAYGDTESAIEAVSAGAIMFLHKQDFTPHLLTRMMEAVIEQGRLRRQLQGLRYQVWSAEPDTLLGLSAGIRDVVENLRFISQHQSIPSVVQAERGAGATLAARLLHRSSAVAEGPFLEVSAASIAGSEKDFFDAKWSPWLQADGGTLAIDGAETLQAALGQMILDQSLEKSRHVLFLLRERAPAPCLSQNRGELMMLPRWLSTSNPWLLRVPPLRERREDIPLLAAHFLQRQRSGGHTTARSLSGGIISKLEAYPWPGNVSELRNTVEYASIQASLEGRDEVSVEHMPASQIEKATLEQPIIHTTTQCWNYKLALARAELELADRAIRDQGLQRKGALADALGYTDRFTFGRRMEKALSAFPQLSIEYTAVAGLFEKAKVP